MSFGLNSNANTGNTNSDALRTATRELHERIEQHPLQKQLASAAITRENYARYLQHLHMLHTAFEARLKELADKEPFNRVIVDDYYQQQFLKRDLERLSAEHSDVIKSPASLPETIKFGYEGAFAENDLALLGALYVLLGSKHGGKYMAHQLRSAWGREDRHEYLDPYGTEFAALWKKFVQDLNTVQDKQPLLDGARATYNAFFAISDAILPAD